MSTSSSSTTSREEFVSSIQRSYAFEQRVARITRRCFTHCVPRVDVITLSEKERACLKSCAQGSVDMELAAGDAVRKSAISIAYNTITNNANP